MVSEASIPLPKLFLKELIAKIDPNGIFAENRFLYAWTYLFFDAPDIKIDVRAVFWKSRNSNIKIDVTANIKKESLYKCWETTWPTGNILWGCVSGFFSLQNRKALLKRRTSPCSSRSKPNEACLKTKKEWFLGKLFDIFWKPHAPNLCFSRNVRIYFGAGKDTSMYSWFPRTKPHIGSS